MPQDPQRQGTESRGPRVPEGVLGSEEHLIVSAHAETQRRLYTLRKERLDVPVLLRAAEERRAACHFPLHPSIEIMFISYGKPGHFTEKKKNLKNKKYTWEKKGSGRPWFSAVVGVVASRRRWRSECSSAERFPESLARHGHTLCSWNLHCRNIIGLASAGWLQVTRPCAAWPQELAEDFVSANRVGAGRWGLGASLSQKGLTFSQWEGQRSRKLQEETQFLEVQHNKESNSGEEGALRPSQAETGNGKFCLILLKM